MKEHFQDLRTPHRKKAFGVGVAGCFWGQAGMGSSATIKLNEDGTVILLMGSVETGAGSNTAMAILISEALGIPMDRIKVISGDTDTCPYDAGAVGSRTSLAMGVAVHQAIEGVKERLLQFAETRLEAPRESLTFGDGNIIVKENPVSSIPIAKVARRLITMNGGPVVATGSNTITDPQYYVFGAQAAAVEVDRDTGKVDVLKVVAVHDVGKAIFRAGVEGQIEGGVAMGLGYALSEEVIFWDGRPVNDSFLDYRIPTTMDVPEIVSVILEKENPLVPDDIRGVGEPPAAPTAAAVANAVYDAVGIRVNHLPLTPERVYWELKHKADN